MIVLRYSREDLDLVPEVFEAGGTTETLDNLCHCEAADRQCRSLTSYGWSGPFVDVNVVGEWHVF